MEFAARAPDFDAVDPAGRHARRDAVRAELYLPHPAIGNVPPPGGVGFVARELPQKRTGEKTIGG